MGNYDGSQKEASLFSKYMQSCLAHALSSEKKGRTLIFTAITSIVVIIFVCAFNADAATSDIMLLLSSSTVALLGVSITGYIFSSDSLRKHADDDYKYIYAAEEHKRGIFHGLKMQFTVAVILIMAFTAIAHLETTGLLSIFLFSITTILFTSFTVWSLRLDIRMMDVDVGLQDAALKILNQQKDELKNNNLVINLNPEEYHQIVKKPGLSGNYEFTRDCDIDDENNKNIIRGYKGKEARKIGSPIDETVSYLYRDMIDEFSPELALGVFEGVETIICKIANVPTDELHTTDRKRLESSLGVGTGRKEDTGISDDIVEYYFILSKYRDNLFIIEDYKSKDDVKQPRQRSYSNRLCISKLDLTLQSDEEVKSKSKDGDRFADYEYITSMTSFIYVLRYELCKKLSGIDLSELNLSSFDFSYGILKKTVLKNSLLMNASFYSCNLSGANLVNCDVTDAGFKFANCEDADFTGAKVNNITMEKVALHGAKFISAEISNSLMPSISGVGINFQNASVVNSKFVYCHMPDSNFNGSNIIKGEFSKTAFKDADMSHAKIAMCYFTECDFYGSDFTESTINFSTMKDTSFRVSKFENVEMMSNTFIKNSFDNCQIKTANFIGSQIFSCSFNSAQVSDCDFTKTSIMPFRLTSETKKRFHDMVEGEMQTTNNRGRHEIIGDEVCNFTNAFMMSCLYTDAIIKYSDFTFAIMQRSIISNTIFECCLFDHGNLSEIYFADSKIDRCQLRYTTLANGNITSCNIRRCDFDNASFKGVTITGTTFYKCTFNDVDPSNLKLIDTTWVETDLTTLIDSMFDNSGVFVNITIEGNGNTYAKKTIPSGKYDSWRDIVHKVRECKA